jgi:hypothetical protein
LQKILDGVEADPAAPRCRNHAATDRDAEAKGISDGTDGRSRHGIAFGKREPLPRDRLRKGSAENREIRLRVPIEDFSGKNPPVGKSDPRPVARPST